MSQGALGEQFGKMRRIPVEAVGFRAPLPPRHDPEATTEPASGTRVPPGFTKVVGALHTGVVKPQAIDPRTTPIRATQDRLTPGSLRKSLENPTRRGRGDGPERRTPILYREGDEHYAIDGHHRIASAMLRGEQFHAVVLTPEHAELSQQHYEGSEHVREMYRTAGVGNTKAFTELYPEWAKNPVRKELGLPPRRRR